MTTSADQAMGPRGGASAVHSGQTGQVGRQANGPHIPLLGVLVVAVWQASVHHALDRMSQISFMAVILTMSVRQFLVLADHFNLSHQLEVKVPLRSRGSRSCAASVATRYRVSFWPGLSPWPTS